MIRAAGKAKYSDDSRMIHVRLDPELHRRLRIIVAAEDTSMQDWLVRMVEAAVSKRWPKIASEGE